MKRIKKNRELMFKVARAIQRYKNKFNMGEWGHKGAQKCNTVACVAGWTVIEAFGFRNIDFCCNGECVLVPREKYEELRGRGLGGAVRRTAMKDGVLLDVPSAARSLLGLEAEESYNLFYGPGSWPEGFQYMRSQADGAAAYLRHLAGPPERKPRRQNLATRKDLAVPELSQNCPDTQQNTAQEEPEPEAVLV